jgi:hypothetical protein
MLHSTVRVVRAAARLAAAHASASGGAHAKLAVEFHTALRITGVLMYAKDYRSMLAAKA